MAVHIEDRSIAIRKQVFEHGGLPMHPTSKSSSVWTVGRFVLIACVVGPLALEASAATVATQYPDYAPGETVVITGSGWAPGETVVIGLHEDPILCPDRLL